MVKLQYLYVLWKWNRKTCKKSNWKDKGSGVIDDLGSHLLDMVNFLIGIKNLKLSHQQNKFENKIWDHATDHVKIEIPLL